jgi:hypothetical protein
LTFEKWGKWKVLDNMHAILRLCVVQRQVSSTVPIFHHDTVPQLTGYRKKTFFWLFSFHCGPFRSDLQKFKDFEEKLHLSRYSKF